MKAIVVDIHNTLLDKELNANKNICSIIKSLSKNHQVFAYTASNVSDAEKLSTQLLKKTGITFVDVVFMNSDIDEVDKKDMLIKQIAKKHSISCIIDNNKKVAKNLAKDYTVLRYMV